ncbi:GNAT family N-acetyltransferase [Roseococcus sp. YIM B11640]|uniref:GNAT family N-acetyltransferase n=1 Tax=Roseococcus sp. YIM B11640 TaxID=3133973 RepID=UPI003C7C1C2F
MTLALHITDRPAREDVDVILDGLVAFNEAAIQRPGRAKADLAVLVRDEGRTVGGAIGSSYYGWAVIDLLWLPAALRREGLGRRVMAAVEEEARARGCIGVRLDTYSFQARGFYEKLGFTLFGTLPDHPPGHTRYWLAKRID